MEIKSYFFDTYALYELIQGNPNYADYQKVNIITTRLNLMELHYGLLRVYGQEKAEEFFNLFREFCIEINDEIVKEANELKLKLKKRRLSYIDCIGYIVSNRLGIKFLTGDKEFSDLENVEFVK